MLNRTSRRLLPVALLAPVLLAFAAPLDGPQFAPEEGATLTKTYEMVTDFALDELSIIADGQDMGAMIGNLDVTVRNDSTVSVSDVYGAVVDGRPAKLERTFDEIGSNTSFEMASDFGDEGEETPTSSDLEGQTVVFAWNAEEGVYDISFKEDEGDEDLLEGLEEDMDLRALLPDGDVSEGDTWKVDLSELSSLAMPGGNLGQSAEGMEDMAEFEEIEELLTGSLEDLMTELFAGECECEYKGVRDEEGTKVAEIAVALEISSSVDLSELMLSIIDIAAEQSGEMMPDLSIDTADLNIDFEGEGVLLWNIEAGLPYAFEIGGDAEIAVDIAIDLEMEGDSASVEAAIEMSGTINETLTTSM